MCHVREAAIQGNPVCSYGFFDYRQMAIVTTWCLMMRLCCQFDPLLLHFNLQVIVVWVYSINVCCVKFPKFF